MPEMTDLGVGGIFAVLVIQMVLNFLKSKKNNVASLPDATQKALQFIAEKTSEIYEMKNDIKKSINQTDELYRLHNVKDLNGTPVWYVNQSLSSSIEKLAENINKQTVVMERVAERLKNNENDHVRLETKIDKLLRVPA